jgi:hypothetical protein
MIDGLWFGGYSGQGGDIRGGFRDLKALSNLAQHRRRYMVAHFARSTGRFERGGSELGSGLRRVFRDGLRP